MNTQIETHMPEDQPKSFFDQPGVQLDNIQVAGGVPFGMVKVTNQSVGLGGAYGSWGFPVDNASLPKFVAERIGSPVRDEFQMDLAPLGFAFRHHMVGLTRAEHIELELQVGERYLRGALEACDWDPGEVDAVLIGMSAPVVPDYTEQIARRAGVPDSAKIVTIHKACDSSVGALQLALNPDLPYNRRLGVNLAETLRGKKVLVGGIEGLSRFLSNSHDVHGLQLFGNGAGVIGVIPGETMRFIVGKSEEVYDDQGLLAVQMQYPHSRSQSEDGSLVDITHDSPNSYRLAGMMHEPLDGGPIEMAGLMGMVKLFVRNGVDVVRDVYQAYQEKLSDLGMKEKEIRVAIAHHANLKINKLKATHLARAGITLNMPWLLSEFGNVSAASNMIAFLRQLPELLAGDHVLFDGFGAGTYYDVLAVALAEAAVGQTG